MISSSAMEAHASLAWKSAWEGMVGDAPPLRQLLRGLSDVKDVRLRLCTEKDPRILEEILDEVIEIYTVEVMAAV